MLPAGEGNTIGDHYTARHDDGTPRGLGPIRNANSNANSPGTITSVRGLDRPRNIAGAMEIEQDEKILDDSLPFTNTALATAAPATAAGNDLADLSTYSRNLGVQNILNPSEAQQAIAPSPSEVPRASLRGLPGQALRESRPLRRTRPSSGSSTSMQPVTSMTTSHTGHSQARHAAQSLTFGSSSGNSSSHVQLSSGREAARHGTGYRAAFGQPTTAEVSQQVADSTSKNPAMGSVQPSGDVDSEQETSPRLAYAYTTSSSSFPPPRRILTPKPPRRSSLGRPMTSTEAAGSQRPPFPRAANNPNIPPVPPLPALIQSMSTPNVSLGSVLATGASHGSGFGYTPGSVPGSYFPSLAPSGNSPRTMPGISPQRSFTQPYFHRDAGLHRDGRSSQSHTPEVQPAVEVSHDSRQQQQDQQQEQLQDREPPQLPYPHEHRIQDVYAESFPPNKSMALSSSQIGSAEGPWSSQGAASGVGARRSLSLSEGQQFITITPSFGEEIHVPVDIHQASKQADEKRLRNAGASARFRARKKEKDREAQLGIQRLETVNREVLKRAQELEVQRDFYRNERNRLQNIMLQTPGMREHVEAGPPSPVSLYGDLPLALSMDLGTGQTQQQQQQQQQQGQSSSANELDPRSQLLHRQSPQLQRSHPHQHTPTHIQPPLYPPMLTAPDHPGQLSSTHLPAPEPSSSSMERPAQRRRTDSGPNIEYHTPSYTMSVPPPPIPSSALPSPLVSSLPPALPLAGPSPRFHSMTPSPLGSPNTTRLPPLRLETPGNNSANVGLGGTATGPSTPEGGHNVSALPLPQYPPATVAQSTHGRSYGTAGWAADSPSPHLQHPPPDPRHQ
ncbi:hypothetical protein SEPCBS119000_005024 [Sporothrix epigloea]|uniref:BZIP domain-containing protein n=1 Tax=Sporothrix epigloea TaxID=1892477 RepID=A0ABP0DY69_9PEZI